MTSLETLINNLEESTLIDSVFLTGSRGMGTSTVASDIDLVIILEKNTVNIRSVYEIIDGSFADIFFFEKSELEKLLNSKSISANSPLEEGILISWILKSEILFDKSGILTRLKEHAPNIVQTISEHEKIDALQRVSYNLYQNKRYFHSDKKEYHEALEARLLYSVVECLSTFLALRDKPWRGEKDAVAYIKSADMSFYEDFCSFNTATSLEGRMSAYESLASKTPSTGTTLFDYSNPVPLSKAPTSYETMKKLSVFWEDMRGGS